MAGKVNVITAVPAATPPMVDVAPGVVADAIPGVLLAHVPLPVSVSVIVAPVHTWLVPDIPAGNAFTVTTAVLMAVQPAPLVTLYEMMEVPAVMPVTTPVVPIPAMPALPLIQVPPGDISLRLVVAPAHTFSVPVIGATAGSPFTVTTLTVVQPVPGKV